MAKKTPKLKPQTPPPAIVDAEREGPAPDPTRAADHAPPTADTALVSFAVRLPPDVHGRIVASTKIRDDQRAGVAAENVRAALTALFGEEELLREVRGVGRAHGATLREQLEAVVRAGIAALRAPPTPPAATPPAPKAAT